MNFFQLTCFVSVAQTLNFARAAEELNVTQPAVTHQIHTLESELNVKLFHRTTRTVELTPDGFIFLDEARKLLAISDRAKARLMNPKRQGEQVFSIGSHSYSSLLLLPNVLRTLKTEYPDIFPRLRIVPPAMSNRILAEEQIDVLLGLQESSEKKISGVYKELLKVPVLCICPKNHPAASQESVSITDLKQDLLLFETPFAGHPSELRSYLLYDRTSSDFRVCDSPEAATILVKSGYGIAIHTGLSISDDSLASVPLKDFPPLSFGVYYKTLNGQPLLKRFIELLREHLMNDGVTAQ